ncbi:MAG: DUF2807 domain-containing protein [Rikenellaceae bacterium]|nr:DUF2807 domain-containing protein [Rikenellaceae bacterium]
MKRLLLMSIFAMATLAVAAQNTTPATATTATTTTTEQVVSIPKTDWLMPFNSIKVDAPLNVVFKKVATDEECRITYDTKGNITSKFKFEVDKKGVLVVSEKSDPKRTSVTDVTIYYNTLREVKIAHAKAEFENRIEGTMFDINVSGGAIASLDVNTLDLAVECTGISRLTINGSTKYLTMRVSTAKVNCSALSTVATIVDASHSAEVRIVVSERLDATTSTGAKLLYKGHPIILRDHTAIFGGDIININ